MKISLVTQMLIFSALMAGTSCNKNTKDQMDQTPGVERKIQFRLYSDHDLSGNNHTIVFKLAIQNSASKFLWDSLLAPMKIKDIPDFMHLLTVEKSVPGNDASKLKVGFYYSIENVGESWHLDSVNVGERFKQVDFNFN